MRNERGAWNFGLNAYWSRQTVCVEGGGEGGDFIRKGGINIPRCPRIDVKYFLILALITCIRTGLTITITENGRVIGSARAHPSPSPLFFFFRARELLTCTIRGHLSEPRLFFSFILHGEEWTSIEWIVTTRYPRDINGLRFGLYLFIIHLVTRILLF